MKLLITRYTCAKCSREFDAPGLEPDLYGEFLLRSPIGELAYLNALEDDTYMEVSDSLKSLPRISDLNPNNRADILQNIFGEVACDLSPSGLPFSMDAMPNCPFCMSQEMAGWSLKEPPELIEIDLPLITHSRWISLQEPQKMVLLKQATNR